VKKSLPAVVNISATRVLKTRQSPSSFFSDPFFRDFFGFGWEFDVPRERREKGLGSGVIVRADGYILTNDHVVSDAAEIVVPLADGWELDAEIVGTDPKTDIAVLKVKEDEVPHLTLGGPSTVGVGDIDLAMGNPFGIGQTVTMGIVSATGRGGLNLEAYEDFIQTDAATNPGNSGGPLVSVRGEVIGINTAIISRSGGNQGIGFAVPCNMAREVMKQLIEKGRVVRGWLGVLIQPVDSSVAKAFGLDESRDALVGDVEPDSPAAKAGLEAGDVIVAVNDEEVEDVRDLRLKVARAGPDSNVNLKVMRDGRERTVPVTLDELPEEQQAARRDTGGAGPLDEVDVDDLTPQITRQLRLPRETFGVVVSRVQPGSAAAEVGLRRGDVIQEVNRQPVNNVADFERAVRRAGAESVLLLVNRGGRTNFIVVEPRG
jgi:serine protease Do